MVFYVLVGGMIALTIIVSELCWEFGETNNPHDSPREVLSRRQEFVLFLQLMSSCSIVNFVGVAVLIIVLTLIFSELPLLDNFFPGSSLVLGLMFFSTSLFQAACLYRVKKQLWC